MFQLRWTAPAERPKLPPIREGWSQADADVYQYLSGWGPV